MRACVLLVVSIAGCRVGGQSAPGASSGGERACIDGTAPPSSPTFVDAATAAPSVFKVILDGPRARVLEATWQPGQKDEPHGHPPMIAYAVTPIFGLAYAADGTSSVIRIEAGRVMKQVAVGSHTFHNTSKDVAKLILIELKPGAERVRMPEGAAPDALTASPDVFQLLEFDAEARVLLGTWKPGQKDAVHGHPALTVYAITDMQGLFWDAQGKSEPVTLKSGTAMFLDPVKAHQFQNTGNADAQLLLIEQHK